MNQNHLNTSLKDKVLQSLGLPEEGFEGKIRLLSPSENSIRLDILLFMAEGKIVNINDLTATEEQIDVQSALQRFKGIGFNSLGPKLWGCERGVSFFRSSDSTPCYIGWNVASLFHVCD